jgi:hypothetical protein
MTKKRNVLNLNFGFVLSASVVLMLIVTGCSFIIHFNLTIPTIEKNEPTEILWQKMFGGSNDDWVYDVSLTNNGALILTGISRSNDLIGCQNFGGDDILLMHVSSNGSLSWQKKLGGEGNDYAYVVEETSDNGFLIIGESNSDNLENTTLKGHYDALIIKTNATGTVVWQRLIGGNQYDNLIAMDYTEDGGVIFAGESKSTNIINCTNNGGSDVFIYKIDAAGLIEWQKLYGGTGDDRALSVTQTSDGGYIVYGSSSSIKPNVTHHGNYDHYCLKLNQSGGIVWQRDFGGSDLDWGFCCQETKDGNFVACGLSASDDINGTINKGNWDMYVLSFNSTGHLLWQKLIGGLWDDLSYQLIITNNGYLICGGTYSRFLTNCTFYGERDYFLVQLDFSGNIRWQKQYGGSKYDYASSFIRLVTGEVIIVGGSASRDIPKTTNNGKWDVYLVCLKANFTSY